MKRMRSRREASKSRQWNEISNRDCRGAEGVEHTQIVTVGLQGFGYRKVVWPSIRLQAFRHPGKVKTQRHRYDVRPPVESPLQGPEDQVRGSRAVAVQHLADERVGHATSDAYASIVDVAAEDRSGAVGAVAMSIASAFAGEVILDQRHAPEGVGFLVDARVEHRHGHAGPIERDSGRAY